MDSVFGVALVQYLLGPPSARGPAVLAVSDFDGVDASHRRLLSRVAELAAAQGLPAVGVVLWPGASGDERALTTLDERIELLAALALVDHVAVLPFAGESGAEAGGLLDLLGAWYDVRALVALAGASAPVPWHALSEAAGVRAYPLVAVEADGAAARAEAARLIEAGEVGRAAALLGHRYAARGEVLAGDRRERLLGFPTANLRPDPRKVLPAAGVYAVWVRLPGERTAAHPGVANIGVRPTIGTGNAPLVEVHLLDVTLDLYALGIAAELVERIRAEQRFPNLEALRARIAADVEQARALLARDTAPAQHWE